MYKALLSLVATFLHTLSQFHLLGDKGVDMAAPQLVLNLVGEKSCDHNFFLEVARKAPQIILKILPIIFLVLHMLTAALVKVPPVVLN